MAPKPPCLATHADIVADDALWDQCKLIGIQEDYDDAGNRADLELRNCTCHSTIARPVKPKQNPPAGTRYWVGAPHGEDMKSRAAIERAISTIERDDQQRLPIRIFAGVPGRGAPIHSMTIRAHANYPDRYVLEVHNTEHAPAVVWSLARGGRGPRGAIRGLVAVIIAGRQAPGELSAAETQHRLARRSTATGLRGWDIFENGRGEWEIQVDSEAFGGVTRDDDRVDDDDVAQLNEARQALAAQLAESGDGPPAWGFDADETDQPAIPELVARAAIARAMHIDMPSLTPPERRVADEFVRHVAEALFSWGGSADWAAIRDTSRSARDPQVWERQVQRSAMEAGLRAVDAENQPYSLQRPPVKWISSNTFGTVPIHYVLPESLTELELAIARALNLATPGGSIFPAGRRFIAAVWENVLDAAAGHVNRVEPGTSEFARMITYNANEIATEHARNWHWVELNNDVPGSVPGAPWQIGKNDNQQAPVYEDPLRQAEWEEPAPDPANVGIFQLAPEAGLAPGELRNAVYAELRFIQPVTDVGIMFADAIIARMRRLAPHALTRERVRLLVLEAAGDEAEWNPVRGGWVFRGSLVRAWAPRAVEPSFVAARAAATAPTPAEERIRTVQGTRHGELALTPRQRAQRFQEQLHSALGAGPDVVEATRVQLKRTVVHGRDVYEKGAAGEVIQNDAENLVVKLDDGTIAAWTPKYLEYLEGDLEIETDFAARVRQLETTPGKRVSSIPAEEDTRIKMIELNPVPNPAWVTNLLAKHFEFLESKVPARWLPKLADVKGKRGRVSAKMPEFGSGQFGTVLPTLDSKIVLKLTTDDTEFAFANELAADLTAQVTCEYHLVAGLPEKHAGRHTYLLWRDAADHVGKLGEVLTAQGRDGDAVERAIDHQHDAAKAAFIALMDGKDARKLLDKWEVACRAMGAAAPELRELADGMIVNMRKDGVFLSDLHGGNIGLIGDRWLCVDPGNVVSFSERA